MKTKTFTVLGAILLLVGFARTVSAQVLFWDPDGITAGTSVSGNWNTTTPNWTVTVDSGINTLWTQGYEADFGVAANYTVTLTEPITVGNITLTGTAGTLTVTGAPPNILSLGTSAIFNTGSRTLLLSAPLAGPSDLTKSGSGTLTLSGSNTYSGGTFSSAGTLSLGSDSISSGGVITSGPLGTGSLTVSAATTLSASGGARAVDNPITLNANMTIGGSAALNFRAGNWTLNGGNRTVTVNNTADTALAGSLADDGAARTFTKAGTGRLILSGTNSGFLGPITVSAGTLQAASDAAIRANAVLTANGAVDLNGFTGNVVGLAGSGTVALGAGTLTIANAGTSRNFTGVISGPGSLVISNLISQQIEGSNTFSGGIVVQVGTLFLRTNAATVGGISQAAGTGTITMEDNGGSPRAAVGGNYSAGIVRITNSIFLKAGRGLLFPSNGGTNQFDGPITGPAGLLRDNNGSGLVVITGSNSYSGGLQIESRAVALGHKNATGKGTFVIGSPTTPPASTLVIAPYVDLSGANAVTNATTVNQSFTIFGSNNFELSGPLTLSNASPTTVTVLGGMSARFSGPVDGPGALTKAGTDPLALSGSNTYAGDTTVSAGTLLVNNPSGSGTSTGLVSVIPAATLGGKGFISGSVSPLSSGATIGASNLVDKLTLRNGLDLSAGGTYAWELAANKDITTGIPGTDFDQLALTGGNLALGGGANLLIQFTGTASTPTSGDPFWQVNHTWKLIALSGTAANPGNSDYLSITGTNGITSGTFSTSIDGGGNSILSYVSTTTPQPVIQNSIPGAGTTNALIQWSAVNGVTYQVQYKNDLSNALWSILGSVTASGSTASITDTNNPPAAKRFYRIVVP